MEKTIIKMMDYLYRENDYDELFKLLKEYNHEFDAKMKFYFAECLKHDGYDNYDLIEYYEESANEGCVMAMPIIADYYYHEYFDYTEEEDLDKFFKYAKMGAENGNVECEYLYGRELVIRSDLYSDDYNEGLFYLKKAAKKGHKESIRFLTDSE